MDIKKFKELPIFGILRGVNVTAIEPLTEIFIRAGLKTVEVTMNTFQAAKVIKKIKKISGKQLTIGAGTVLDMKTLWPALEAGASFVVTPVLIKDVTEYCLKNKIPVFPGALTPQEIYQAWNAGASLVKVFPAKFFGPQYFKEIKGPFADIELLACGGISKANIKDFFACGASAVAFGASILNPRLFTNQGFSKIERDIKKLIDAYEADSR